MPPLVGPETVSVETVDALAQDAAFMGALQGEPGTSESTLPGLSARTALGFEISVAGLKAVADEWGVTVSDADRSSAEETVSQQVTGELSAEARSSLIDYVAHLNALAQEFSELDPSDTEQMRALYDGIPSQWNQVCAAIVGVAEANAAELEAEARSGSSVEEMAEGVSGAQLVANPDEGCLPASAFPEELADAVEGAATGATVGPVTVESPRGSAVYFVRVDEFQHLSFDEAEDELAQLVSSLGDAQSGGPMVYVSAWLNDRIEVNPRYGSGVDFSTGQVAVVPPEAPVTTGTTLPTGVGSGGATGSEPQPTP